MTVIDSIVRGIDGAVPLHRYDEMARQNGSLCQTAQALGISLEFTGPIKGIGQITPIRLCRSADGVWLVAFRYLLLVF